MTDPSRVRMTGPLAPFAPGLAAELRRQGYTPDSTARQLRLVAHLSRWLAAEGLDSQDLASAEVERFLETRRAAYSSYFSSRALAPLLAYLRGHQATPPPSPLPPPDGPIEELLHRYRLYLTTERALSGKGARDYANAVRPFLEGRLSQETLSLDRLGAVDVTAFVVASCPRLSPGTVKLTMTALRSLLGFLHLEGTIERPLTAAVPSVARWRLAELPKRLDPSQVRSLLASCDRDTATGRRDFAILTVLSRLGLRAGELARLALDDIDWRAGEIVVRGKGRREERLPLPADVGEAITAYLRGGRPETAKGRSVFVAVNAPHRSLGGDAVSEIVARAASRCGLGRIRAHRLRHTAASETLRGGASLTEVGQLLRHRRAVTTAIYAKVDREALRKIARPWPGGAR